MIMNDKEIEQLINDKITHHEFKVTVISSIVGFLIFSIIFLWLLFLTIILMKTLIIYENIYL